MPDTEDFHALLAAARAGEADALDRLVRRFYPAVRALVHRSLATDLRRKKPWLMAVFSTGDVVQEVFCSVVRDLDGFESTNEGAFVRFLSTMVQNRLIDAVRFHEALRRDARRTTPSPPDLSELHASGYGPADAAESEDQMRRYLRALATLAARDAAVLRERLQTNATFRQIAAALGYPSEDAARKAFAAAQARLLLAMQPNEPT